MRYFIDFETLGIRPNCKIVQCGLILFNKVQMIQEYLWNIDPISQSDRTMDLQTIMFWFENKDKITWLGEPTPISRHTFQNEIEYVIRTSYDPEIENELWCNGLLFDIPILQSLIQLPFKYNEYRDYRTLRTFLNIPKTGEYDHCALNDCKVCVKEVINYGKY